VAEHGAERIFREQLTNRAISAAAGAFAGDPQHYQQVVGLLSAGTQLGQLTWSRSQESEADHIGIIYMARAGYDPAQSIVLWQNMAKASGPSPPEYLSTHPSGETRIRQLRGWLPEARREAKQADEVAAT
jgi:predicted Zn-dependent protease